MSTQAVSNGFTGDTTPIQHSEQQTTKPTIDCTDVAEDVISKGTSAKDKKLGKVTTTIEIITSVTDYHLCFDSNDRGTEETATKTTTGRQRLPY